jgi:hypothetical protein
LKLTLGHKAENPKEFNEWVSNITAVIAEVLFEALSFSNHKLTSHFSDGGFQRDIFAANVFSASKIQRPALGVVNFFLKRTNEIKFSVSRWSF